MSVRKVTYHLTNTKTKNKPVRQNSQTSSTFGKFSFYQILFDCTLSAKSSDIHQPRTSPYPSFVRDFFHSNLRDSKHSTPVYFPVFAVFVPAPLRIIRTSIYIIQNSIDSQLGNRILPCLTDTVILLSLNTFFRVQNLIVRFINAIILSGESIIVFPQLTNIS